MHPPASRSVRQTFPVRIVAEIAARAGWHPLKWLVYRSEPLLSPGLPPQPQNRHTLMVSLPAVNVCVCRTPSPIESEYSQTVCALLQYTQNLYHSPLAAFVVLVSDYP